MEKQQQEVLTLQQSLTTVKKEKDTLEQDLGVLVRFTFPCCVFSNSLADASCGLMIEPLFNVPSI